MTNFNKLEVGSVLSETQYYKVVKKVGDKVEFVTDNGETVTVNRGYVESLIVSADQYSREEKITRTELAEMLIQNRNVVMTLNFNKQVKEADVAAEIQAAYENSTPKEFAAKMKKAVKKGLNGEERTMTGRHHGGKDDFGRLHFIDMDILKDASKSYDTRQRLVDPRTLNWLIVNGVKYIAK